MVLLIASLAVAGMGAVRDGTQHLMHGTGADMTLQSEGERALDRIVRDLRESGRVSDFDGHPDADFPFLMTDGDTGDNAYFAAQDYDHEPAVQHVPEGSPAYGPSTEIVFKVLDAGGEDGKPTTADGRIEWLPYDVAYLLVTRNPGTPRECNQLVRRNLGDGSEEVVASYVERIRFEDWISAAAEGDYTLGPGHIRVSLHLAMPDPGRPGWLTKRFFVTVVQMRNTEG